MTDFFQNDGNTNILPPVRKNSSDRTDSRSGRRRTPTREKARRASINKSIEFPEDEDKTAQELVISSLKRFEDSPDLNYDESPTIKFQPVADELPPANPLVTEKYSMEADMLFGWKPKFIMKAPIPLSFTSSMLEEIVNTLHYQQKSDPFPELVYQGFRPENSFFLHHKFSSPETYIFKLPPALQSRHAMYWKMTNNTVNPKRPFVGMKKDVSADCLVFDSIFEHGNLDTAIRKRKDEYDLFLKVDSNTRGHTCWYYFKVQNMRKGQTVKFNICNLSRTDSLYQRGLKPYVHSKRLFDAKNIGWAQDGENITYKPSNIYYLSQNFDEEYSTKRFHKLSFEYTFPYDNDTVSFALCIPYSYSQLLQFIQTITDAQSTKKNGAYLTSSKLCCSLGGVNVPLLTITDPDESEVPLCRRQYVVCSARVHPGETNSSWMMEGFITELCKDTAIAKYLRKKFIFKIVPMLNPDGVIVGNHRTGFCGNDLNRQYISPQTVLHPSIVAIKDLIRDLGQEKKNSIFAYFDFHGHSLMKNVFMYGAEFPIHTLNYYRIKLLPMIISKNTEMFRYRSCTFTIPKCKLATARAVFSMNYGIVHCYTIEASYASYLNAEKENIPFNQESFMGMGIAVAGGIFEYRKLIEEEEIHALTLRIRQEMMVDQEKDTLDSAKSMENSSFEGVDEKGDPKQNGQGNDNNEDKKRSNKFRIKKARPMKIDYLGKINAASLEPVERDRKGKGKERDASLKAKGGLRGVFKGHIVNTGIARLIQEIKDDVMRRGFKEADGEENLSEHASSKGESDAGCAEDDLDENEMELMQEDIIYNITEFTNMCKEEKIDIQTYKLKPKSTRLIEKPLKDKRFQTLSPEKEVSASPERSAKSPRKTTLTFPKYTQRGNNWASKLKEKAPLMPKQMQMVVDRFGETSLDTQEPLYSFCAGTFSGAKVFKKYITSVYRDQKKPADSKDHIQKALEAHIQPQQPQLINTDIVKIVKLNPTFKESGQDRTIFKPDGLSSLRTKRIEVSSQRPEVSSQKSDRTVNGVPPPKSIKSIRGYDQGKTKGRPGARDAYSFDQKNVVQDSSLNTFLANLPLSTENDNDQDGEHDRENSLDVEKMTYVSAVPQVSIVQATVTSHYVTTGAIALRKDKKLPMSYVAHKRTMKLKQKGSNQYAEAYSLC